MIKDLLSSIISQQFQISEYRKKKLLNESAFIIRCLLVQQIFLFATAFEKAFKSFCDSLNERLEK